ncbi:MAG: hypothetical protein H7A23_11940 [Leptospiraceae bacterium]|nr:hypothetical protein [Leptospiraceae bacterium]MCP5495258.1 hypothetical protein [Leptospiraceae bacterium]
MVNRQYYLFIGAISLFVFSLYLLFSVPSSKESKEVSPLKTIGDTFGFKHTSSLDNYNDPFYPDAPNPFDENEELLDEVERLWPDALNSVTLWPQALYPEKNKQKEKVREEWIDFSNKYPENIYVPSEYKEPITEEKAAEIRQELDNYTEMETKFASFNASSKYAEPGSEPPKSPKEEEVSPEVQRSYFQYKTKELESRIQLVEYMMEKSYLNADQKETALKDLQSWKKELNQIIEISKQVPK